ncbi:MAG: amidohydrolase family protein, partial [Acidimicrobiia bacterium]
ARPEAAPEGLARLGEFGPRVTPCLGPHAIYTVDEAVLRGVAELSEATGAPVQIHLSETEDEVITCWADNGCRPTEYLDRIGLLTPRTVLSHGVWLDDAELELIARRGSTIVTNPASNMKLAVGKVFRYRDARDAGIPIGIGTDGVASNNSLDLLAELKLLALVQKHTDQDPKVLPAAEAWEIATGVAAPLLGGTPLRVGAPADFLLVDANAVEMTPSPLVDALVYSGSGAVVQTVVVDGAVIMQDRHIEGADEVVEHVQAISRRIRTS